jgi:aldehyde:ferredoxin oxidoreductase
MINVNRGVDGAQDTLPDVFLKTPRVISKQEFVVQDMDEMIRRYYSLQGWSDMGIPTETKLRELDIP